MTKHSVKIKKSFQRKRLCICLTYISPKTYKYFKAKNLTFNRLVIIFHWSSMVLFIFISKNFLVKKTANFLRTLLASMIKYQPNLFKNFC